MYRRPFSTPTTPDPEIAAPPVDADGRRLSPGRLRLLLLIGSAALVAVPLALAEPAAHWANDSQLFTLLRGMAVIKAGLAAFALAVVWWRLGQAAAPRFAATMIGGVWVLALATGLIWQLTAVLAASALFHAATIALLYTAWRDVGSGMER
jgi:hypothetical protein